MPLVDAVIDVEAKEDLEQKVEVCVLHVLLLVDPTVTISAGVREVDLEEAPVRVMLPSDNASHEGHLVASRYPVREFI